MLIETAGLQAGWRKVGWFSPHSRSEGTVNPQKHAKLSHLGLDIWNLSFPKHTGRWEKTPFSGTSEELVETLVSNFSFYLEKW